MLTFDTYQAKSFIAVQNHASNKEEVMHWAIGLGEEAGEALSVIKHKYYGGQYEPEDMVAELGDVLWYVASLCTSMGFDLQDVADYNLAKLHHRYPTMEFDDVRSKARHDLDVRFRDSDVYGEIMGRINAKLKERYGTNNA